MFFDVYSSVYGHLFYLIFRYEGVFIGVIKPVSLSYIAYSYVFFYRGKGFMMRFLVGY